MFFNHFRLLSDDFVAFWIFLLFLETWMENFLEPWMEKILEHGWRVFWDMDGEHYVINMDKEHSGTWM